MTDLTAVCLFDGIGGFPLALSRAGVRTVLSCEIDPAARGVLADHFDHVLHDDVRTLTADDCRRAGFVPERGIICAGWPCQGNSVAGHREGMGDPRSGLWVHVARLLSELRPRWFIGENVPGLLSVNDGWDFAEILTDLDRLGYGVCWRVLDAQYFGVPQRRRRVVIVGCLGDRAAPVQVLLEPEGMQRDSAQGSESEAGASVASESRSRGSRAELTVVSTLQAGGATADGDSTPKRQPAAISSRWVVSALTSSHGGPDDNDAQANHLIGFDLAQITSSTNRSNPQPGDPMTPLHAGGQPHIAHALTAEGHDASEDGTGRGTPLVPMAFAWQAGGKNDASGAFAEDMTPTMPRKQTLAVQTATAVRRLTPLECERLQGFPDGWTATSNGKPQADSPRYRQLGNAIAVPVFEWVARRLVATDEAMQDGAA